MKVAKEPKPERWQTHVYLTADDFANLKKIADKESRSTTGQIEFFLRKSIASYLDEKVTPS